MHRQRRLLRPDPAATATPPSRRRSAAAAARPDSHDTTTATSSASSAYLRGASSSAIRATLASRDDEAPTSAEAAGDVDQQHALTLAEGSDSAQSLNQRDGIPSGPYSHFLCRNSVSPNMRRDQGTHSTAKATEGQPVAPSGTGSAPGLRSAPRRCRRWPGRSSVCEPAFGGRPGEAPQPPGVVGVARTRAVRAATVRRRSAPRRPSRRGSAPMPPRRTSPARWRRPGRLRGTSMRDSVLIGPRGDQPSLRPVRLRPSKRVSSRSTTHLVADT